MARTVKGDLEELLKAANILHPNLQFTLEKANEKGNFAFLEIDVKVDTQKDLIFG